MIFEVLTDLVLIQAFTKTEVWYICVLISFDVWFLSRLPGRAISGPDAHVRYIIYMYTYMFGNMYMFTHILQHVPQRLVSLRAEVPKFTLVVSTLKLGTAHTCMYCIPQALNVYSMSWGSMF